MGVDQFRLPAQRMMSQLAKARMTEQKIMMLVSAKPLSSRLAISKNEALCNAWMNKYPSMFLSMKNVEGMSIDDAYIYFRALAARLCSDHAYLIDSPRVAELEKSLLKSILEDNADTGAVSNLLLTLCRALHAHRGKPAILLIDEYDVPLARAER